MHDFIATLVHRIEGAIPLEVALAELRAMGAPPIEAIKAIRVALGVDLREAEIILSSSPAWALEVAASRPLQEEALALLMKEAEG